MDVLGNRVRRRLTAGSAGEHNAHLGVEGDTSLDDARHSSELGPCRGDTSGVAGRTLALAVVAETGRLDD